MRRLIIVYNPRSSHFLEIKEKVLEPARKLRGWMVAKYEVQQASVDENAKKLAKFLIDGDLVIAAGGDGTATMAMNSVMNTEAKDVRFGVMGFGNFNDVSRCFGSMGFKEIVEASPREVWPLECKVNGEHWRYALCYVTVGMFAEACSLFDEPKMRKSLRKGNKKTIYSLFSLALWWIREHKRNFMPSFSLVDIDGDEFDKTGCADYMAINSATVAKVMKGERNFVKRDTFLSSTSETTRFFKMIGFMMRAVFSGIPSSETDYDKIRFNVESSVMIQAEGEYQKLEKVREIEIKKCKKPLLAVIRPEK